MTALHVDLTDSNGKDMAKYTMAVVVKMTGVPAHKIRSFEKFGLCNPSRTDSRQRLYSDNDVELIRKIVLWQKDGVNLAGIKVILEMKNPENSRKAKL